MMILYFKVMWGHIEVSTGGGQSQQLGWQCTNDVEVNVVLWIQLMSFNDIEGYTRSLMSLWVIQRHQVQTKIFAGHSMTIKSIKSTWSTWSSGSVTRHVQSLIHSRILEIRWEEYFNLQTTPKLFDVTRPFSDTRRRTLTMGWQLNHTIVWRTQIIIKDNWCQPLTDEINPYEKGWTNRK